MRFNSVIR